MVLRSGGAYQTKHVAALAAQIDINLPRCVPIVCLSDVELRIPGVEWIPLQYDWPGWWSKMELFRPDILGDLLYFDLDTVIVGSLQGLLGLQQRAMLRDFYRDGVRRKEGLGSGLMFLPEHQRLCMWKHWWAARPETAMQRHRRGGDQEFLELYWRNPKTLRIQDEIPGQVVSWKVHCQNGVPPEAKVICMHGKPKPWDLPQFKHLYE